MFKPLDTILPVLETTPLRWKTLCQSPAPRPAQPQTRRG